MKRINKFGLGLTLAAVSAMSLTSCIEETFPTNAATADQVGQSPSATEGLLMAIPAYLNSAYFSSSYDWACYGYGALMHIRDVETQDMATADESQYNQYWAFGENKYMGRDYVFSQWLWGYQTKFINTTNNLIATADIETVSDEIKGFLAAAYAYRAMMYLDMAREYEFLANDKTQAKSPEGNDITGLTVPIIAETTGESDARSNKRATREEMTEFILGDLNKAEANIVYLTRNDKTLPHLDVVYGLYARLYMWLENYTEAAKYARKAIDATNSAPMTQEAAMNPQSGFNDINRWMLGSQVTKEALFNNLSHWVSFASNETNYGYSGGGGCWVQLDANMYNRVSNTDWRKLMFKAPAGSPLDGKMVYIDNSKGAEMPVYASTKFRPNQGNMDDYSISAASAFPIMRVEEMYFIEAEAVAHTDAARGAALLTNFMKTYRDPNYSTDKTGVDDVVEEIVFQKRIELWGEGQSFFDIKRLNLPQTRGYNGTNHLESERFNTTTRPAWMNWVIIVSEENGNTGVAKYNNPDPTDKYDPWTAK